MASLRDKLIRNFNDVELETSARAPVYDGTRSGSVAGPREGTVAQKLGAGFDIVPRASAPALSLPLRAEEMFVILEGEGTLRVAGEVIPIRAGDVIDIPPGPEYPHQIINTSDAPLKYLSISTQEFPEVCEYPDSGKYLAYTRTRGPCCKVGACTGPIRTWITGTAKRESEVG